MPELTPIRIRGKRKAKLEEKWHYGKQRKMQYSGAPAERGSSVVSDLSASKSSDKRKRRKQDSHLSLLEQLPTEILHAIFEFSANPDLPLTSRCLESQLKSSNHLHHKLTCRVLYPVLEGKESSHVELKHALRLMNSRFFTYQFFKEFLRAEFESRNLHEEWQACAAQADQSLLDKEVWVVSTWDKLRPNGNLPPPLKLLRGPFTEEKMRFLDYISYPLRHDTSETASRLDPVYLEIAKEGLQQAVLENAKDAIRSFWELGMKPDTELLRKAVIDAGCDREAVMELVTRARSLLPTSVDFLDPTLWAWAEKARNAGDEKGAWLVELLKDSARCVRRDEQRGLEFEKAWSEA